MTRQSAGERADLEGAAGMSLRAAEALETEQEEQQDEDQAAEPAPVTWHAIGAEPAKPKPDVAAGWDFEIPPAVRPYLKPDEIKVIPVRQHVVLLIGPGLAAGGGLAAAVALNGWAWSARHASGPVVHTIWIAYLLGVLWAAYRWAEWRQTWFVVTGHRLILIKARRLIGRDVTMLPLTKLRDLAYRQTGIGRALGYATFDFASIGTEKALDLVPYLPWPEWLYQRVTELTMPSDEGKVIKRRTG